MQVSLIEPLGAYVLTIVFVMCLYNSAVRTYPNMKLYIRYDYQSNIEGSFICLSSHPGILAVVADY